MLKLAELGFIKIASGKHGDISCVLILNPHLVLKKHKEKKTPGFDDKIYNCILENVASYGMQDFTPPPKQPATQAPPLPAPPPPKLSKPTLKAPPKPKPSDPLIKSGPPARLDGATPRK
jgi:hypothetical protein